MSSNVFAKPNSSSPVTTRRALTTDNDTAHGSQRSVARRSLSGKFRNLFRKNSPSPKRRVVQNEEQISSRPSTVPVKTTVETPQLRPPTISWPFGKKSKSTTPNSPTKPSKKTKQRWETPTVEEIRPTTYPDNNVTRRPVDHTTNSIERPSSFPNYESTPTKGFRDFMVLDQGTHPQQVKHNIIGN